MIKKVFGIIIAVLLLIVVGFFALNNYIYNEKQGDSINTMENSNSVITNSASSMQITPISHASMVLMMGGQVLYNDPVGINGFKNQPEPAIVLISDIHADHFDIDTLKSVSKPDTIIVVPQAVADELPKDVPGTVVVLKNGEKTVQKNIEIEAIAMYNIPESEGAYHTKGRGNGYVLSADGKRVYIAGDTSATPEMKSLQNIDIAFIPMNLPYTMDVEEAAEGVLAFKPKVVHPYHYKGQDIKLFKEIVESKNPNIAVDLLNFYPEN